jgi:hypothetical protein
MAISNKTKRKKGQEEIVGFVMIVVIVVVIGLIFLILSAKTPDSLTQESKDIRAFLGSMQEYTSPCSIGYEGNQRKLGELLKECYEGKKCVSGEESCSVLNSSISKILEASWNVGEDSALQGYVFEAYYSKNVSSQEKGQKEEILTVEKGNCETPVVRSSSGFYSVFPGTISYSLKICYSSP